MCIKIPFIFMIDFLIIISKDKHVKLFSKVGWARRDELVRGNWRCFKSTLAEILLTSFTKMILLRVLTSQVSTTYSQAGTCLGLDIKDPKDKVKKDVDPRPVPPSPLFWTFRLHLFWRTLKKGRMLRQKSTQSGGDLRKVWQIQLYPKI